MPQSNMPPSYSHGLAAGTHAHSVFATMTNTKTSEAIDGVCRIPATPSRPPPSPFEKLPLELRLRILSFTDLSARGDYCEDHDVIHIDNGSIFRQQDGPWFRKEDGALTHGSNNRERYEPKGLRSRSLPLSLLYVNRQTYHDAIEILYRGSHFVVAPTSKRAWDLFRRLPPAGLQRIRRITLRASLGDAELIFRDATFIASHDLTRHLATLWPKWADFIRENFDVEHLSVFVDLSRAGRWCQNHPPEGTLSATYEYYRFVTSALCRIGPIRDVAFDLAWVHDLAPWMEREVLGSRFKGEINDPHPDPAGYMMGDDDSGVPYWHDNDERVPGSNFTNE